MSFRTNSHNYLDLMVRFAEGKLSGTHFVTKFMTLWREERDADYAIKKSWKAPYDEMLIDLLKKGKITKEEFAMKWNALWGLSKADQSFRDLSDKIFTACDVFNPDSDSREDYEYGEDELRTFVMKIVPQLKEHPLLQDSRLSCRGGST